MSLLVLRAILLSSTLISFFFREVDGQWIEEEKLEAHSDWVRDVAWALNVGLPVSTFACVPR